MIKIVAMFFLSRSWLEGSFLVRSRSTTVLDLTSLDHHWISMGLITMQDRRSFLIQLSLFTGFTAKAQGHPMLIHDFSNRSLTSELGTRWRAVSDQVMGGVSEAKIDITTIEGRHCLQLTGDVRLENNGGFIQASLDLAPMDNIFDATAYRGIRLVVRGNGERYSLHLRTADTKRPWQSYRAAILVDPKWQTIDLPFTAFAPHRLDTALNLERLRRLGLVAIGRAYFADLAVAEVSFYS